MKCYREIQKAFKQLPGSTTIRSWCESSGYPRSRATMATIIGDHSPVDPESVIYAAYCLGISKKAIIDILDQYQAEKPHPSVRILKGLIGKEGDITRGEYDLLASFRKLDGAKQHLVLEMAQKLEG